ncbi:MAG: glycoside hydrolase family 18 protein [Acutalibacter sp.]|nr:glycoside hydrolase family 18 protein [Acutalibacter sp.]
MFIHIVRQGDTVWQLAQQYGVSANRIISDNGIQNPQRLPVGQALLILIPETVYTVRPGDTLESIAARFSIPEIELLQNNPNLIFSPYLTAGQTIVIHFTEPKRRTVSLNGYAYPYIYRNELRRTLPYLTYLTIFGYGFTESGELIPIDDQWMINMAYEYRAAPVMLLSSITEEGNFSGQRASILFRDIALQDRVFDQIVAVMREKGYLGLDIDFEYVEAADAGNYQNFLRRAIERMHAEGFFVNVDLAPKISATQEGLLYESHDYAAIGALADTVLLMTYEWGYTFGPPMAVAPLNQVRRVVTYGASAIPPDKIMMGIPNYGYDWILPFERGITRATAIGNEYAVQIAQRNNVPITFDETAYSPTFSYRSSQHEHVVWFEDVRSISGKFDLLEEFSLRGGGYWNVMRSFAQNWAFVSARYRIEKIV